MMFDKMDNEKGQQNVVPQNQEFETVSGQSGSDKDYPSWKDQFYDFTQNTTLHGLRYVALREAGIIRRLLWVLLMCLCFAIMTIQIADRAIYFSQSPISVNIKINHNDSLKFPFVTICNQNAFRISAADEYNWYELIQQLYDSTVSTREIDWNKLNASTLTFSDLFLKAGHTKEDMIYRCSFNNIKCDAKDFEEKLTDYGLCYTFKPKKKSILSQYGDTKEVLTTQTGSDHGLKLILNIEQYESMKGPSHASGIKLLAHHDTDVPRVKELGISVPVDAYALIGLELTVIENLPKPVGKCAKKDLLFSREYSKDDCLFECLNRRIESVCGCRSYLVPQRSGKLKECTIRQYLQCYKKNFDTMFNNNRKYCDCPTACVYGVYDPVMSYASTAENAINTVRAKPNGRGIQIHPQQRKLEGKIKKAIETKHRKNVVRYQKFDELRNNLRLARIELKNNLELEVHSLIDRWIARINRWIKYDTKVLAKRKKLFYYQIFNYEKNFITARNIMEEQTFSSLCRGFLELRKAVEQTIGYLTDYKKGDDPTHLVFYSTKLAIDIKLSNVDSALDNYTTLYNALLYGRPILNYTYKSYSEEDNQKVLPSSYFRRILNQYKDVIDNSDFVDKNIKDVSRSLTDYVLLLEQVHKSGRVDKADMNDKSNRFVSSCSNFVKSKTRFYKECVDKPLSFLNEASEKLETAADNHIEALVTIVDDLKSLKIRFKDIQQNEMNSIREFLSLCREYIEFGNITKESVYLRSVAEKKSIAEIVVFMEGFKLRGKSIYDNALKVKESSGVIWSMILNDKDIIEYYRLANESEFLQNYTEFYINGRQVLIDESILTWSPDTLISHNASALEESFEELFNDLLLFYQEAKIDEHFDKENYLSIDVFYRELSYMEITQHEAYDIFALLCDIGGSMGLFIGASAITLFELLDVVFHISAHKLLGDT